MGTGNIWGGLHKIGGWEPSTNYGIKEEERKKEYQGEEKLSLDERARLYINKSLCSY